MIYNANIAKDIYLRVNKNILCSSNHMLLQLVEFVFHNLRRRLNYNNCYQNHGGYDKETQLGQTEKEVKRVKVQQSAF